MRIKDYILRMILYCLRLFPIKKNKVLFISYYGNYYNDNPMMISRELESHSDIDIVWGFEKGIEAPAHIRGVRVSSFKFLYELATARVWVDNCRKRIWTVKRNKQYYIQTWHGNLGNKRVEGAATDTLSPDYIKRAKHDSSMIDLMISGSTFFTSLIKNYFWYTGQIMECGTPRLDVFFRDQQTIIAKVRQCFEVGQKTSIVLYAPTYRENRSLESYILDFEKIKKSFERLLNRQCVVFIRLHPNVANKANSIQYNESVFNASVYPDLYELIMASDAVISDYSSLTFEAGLLHKPVFLYVPDLLEYKRERGFYMEIEELPYLLAENEELLIDAISNYNKEEYDNEVEAFNQQLGIIEDGKASERVADRIISILSDY